MEQIQKPTFLNELSHFENFFSRMGLKRIEGAIFGLLVLSNEDLPSEQIQSQLHLSQSAVSMALKNLSSLGFIETRDDREEKVKKHSAKEDSLAIVASIFRKREQEYIQEFKVMVERNYQMSIESDGADAPRSKRLLSMIQTCLVAENVMNFVIEVTRKYSQNEYAPLLEHFSKLMTFLEQKGNWQGPLTRKLTKGLSEKFFRGLERIETSLENHRHEQ